MITYYYKPKETMSKTGYIYKLCCNNPEITDCYVGSTKNEKVRKNGHKVRCNGGGNKSHYNVYQCIRTNGGWDNWSMVRLEEFKFDDRAELNARERHWLETIGATLNKLIPTRTKQELYQDQREERLKKGKEYREANPEIIKQRKKIYAENNKEKIADHAKVWREENKEIIAQKKKESYQNNREVVLKKVKEYTHKNKQRIAEYKKQYTEENKEKIAEKRKEYSESNKELLRKKANEYYQKNKQHVLNRMKEKITCECGSTFRKGGKTNHIKSQKHKDFITSMPSLP